MDFIVVILTVLGVLACCRIILRALRVYREMKKYSLEQKASACVEFSDSSMIKGSDFFIMVNTGENLCEPKEDINYVDFIENSNFFIGEN